MAESCFEMNNNNTTANGFIKSESRGSLYSAVKRCVSTPDSTSKCDRSAYGVSFMRNKENKLKQFRQSLKQRIPQRVSRNKSMPHLDSGFDSIDSSSASSISGTGSSPGSGETTDTDNDLDEDAWKTFDYPFENLAMSGGGAKGYAYIGALKAFQDSGLFSKIKRVVGTSAGAVIGGMLVVDGTPQEIANFFKCDVKKLFQDKNTVMCLFIPRLLTKFGLNSGQRFYEVYGDYLRRKTGDADITFKKVVEVYGKELCVTVTNLSRMCSEYCHHTTTPDLPIRKAVRMSMAFPGIYECMKENLTGSGDNIYVDGGTLENYPVQYFDDIDPETNESIFNEKTVGLYLVSEDQFSHQMWMNIFGTYLDQIPTYLPDTKLAKERLKDEIKRRKKLDESFDTDNYLAELKRFPYYNDGKRYMKHFEILNKEQIEISGPKKYIRAMLSTLLLSQKHMLVKPSDLHRTVGINCGYIDTKDTGIEAGDREFMIRQGYEQTRSFLQSFIRNKLRPLKDKRLPSSSSAAANRTMKRPSSLPTGLVNYASFLAKGKFPNPQLPSPSECQEPTFVSQVSDCTATIGCSTSDAGDGIASHSDVVFDLCDDNDRDVGKVTPSPAADWGTASDGCGASTSTPCHEWQNSSVTDLSEPFSTNL